LKQPDRPTFFLDRCLGKEIIATKLRDAGVPVEIHDDNFAPDARDEEWLTEAGRLGWIVLTKDKRFHSRTLEVRAIARARVAVFTLTAGSMRGSEMAQVFGEVAHKMSRVAQSNRKPFIATVSRTGRIKIVLSAKRLRHYE